MTFAKPRSGLANGRAALHAPVLDRSKDVRPPAFPCKPDPTSSFCRMRADGRDDGAQRVERSGTRRKRDARGAREAAHDLIVIDDQRFTGARRELAAGAHGPTSADGRAG